MEGFATGKRGGDTWGRFSSAFKPPTRLLSSIKGVIDLGYISTPPPDPLATDLNISEGFYKNDVEMVKFVARFSIVFAFSNDGYELRDTDTMTLG
ncbi:unnamed protein product [Lactuca virosa]|uniref:Uncharacterized protein n=1 Tax=Lactuca virosa TaxID=75947 RepID=A0AAU9PS51_9ASTR|nr:unnamed protein product [Lactuca virosa]